MAKTIKSNKVGVLAKQFPFHNITLAISILTMFALTMNDSWKFSPYGSGILCMSNLFFLFFLTKAKSFAGNISNIVKAFVLISLLVNATATYFNYSYNSNKKKFYIDWNLRKSKIMKYANINKQIGISNVIDLKSKETNSSNN